MATQMQLKKIAWPPGLLERKKQQQQSRVFLTLFLMFRLTWTTEKEPGRRISLKDKHENFIAAVRKLTNVSGQVKMSGSEKIVAIVNTGNKIFGNTYDNSSIKIMCNQYVLRFSRTIRHCIVVKNNGKERQKTVLHVQICFFANQENSVLHEQICFCFFFC